jgi:hypothetical protein
VLEGLGLVGLGLGSDFSRGKDKEPVLLHPKELHLCQPPSPLPPPPEITHCHCRGSGRILARAGANGDYYLTRLHSSFEAKRLSLSLSLSFISIERAVFFIQRAVFFIQRAAFFNHLFVHALDSFPSRGLTTDSSTTNHSHPVFHGFLFPLTNNISG